MLDLSQNPALMATAAASPFNGDDGNMELLAGSMAMISHCTIPHNHHHDHDVLNILSSLELCRFSNLINTTPNPNPIPCHNSSASSSNGEIEVLLDDEDDDYDDDDDDGGVGDAAGEMISTDLKTKKKIPPQGVSCKRNQVVGVKRRLDRAEHAILEWDAASPLPSSFWDSRREQADSYLQAVDQLQGIVRSLCVMWRAEDKDAGIRSAQLDRARNLHQLAMVLLEEEFRHMLVMHSECLGPVRLYKSVCGMSSFPSSSPQNRHEEDYSLWLAAVAAAAGRDLQEGEDELRRCHDGDNDDNDDDDDEAHCNPPNTPTPCFIPQIPEDLNITLVLLPLEKICILHEISRRMVGGGHGHECCLVYTSIRKSILEQSLYELGLEKLSMEEVQKMEWDELEEKIKKWVQVLKLSVKVVFGSERRLVDDIFGGHGQSPWNHICYAQVAKGAMKLFLSFAEAVAFSRRSQEKLFQILGMYETLRDLLPDILSLFSDDAGSSMRSEARGVLMRLGEAARGTFSEFENAIQRDPAKLTVGGGAIHPLSRYVMNYIRLLVDYKEILTQLLGDKKKERMKGRTGSVASLIMGTIEGDDDILSEADHLSPLAVQIVWLIVLLECNLDAKSKLYKDLALTYLFLMNNMRYIVEKAKQHPELASLLGQDWLAKHEAKVLQYATNYERVGWKKVLSCLREDHPSSVVNGNSGVVALRIVLKERFKTFNSALDEVQKAQSTWHIPDTQLREDLRVSIAMKLISAYSSFLGHFRMYMESGRQAERYIKYTPEDLEILLTTLFQGTAPLIPSKGRFFHRSHDSGRVLSMIN